MIKEEEWAMIRQLEKQGLNKTEISRRMGLDRKTVRRALTTEDLPKYKRKSSADTKLEPYREYLETRLEKYNLTSMKLFNEIKDQGFNGKYGIVNIHVKKLKNNYRNQAVLRFETLPGEQAQVDWGYFGEFYDYEKKKWIKLCCFLMVLGYSRMKFIQFFEKDSTDEFLEGHNRAFEYFGGYSKEILYDNLKSVVIKRAFKQKDSEFNKKFIEYSGFYGFKPVLARPYRPQTKGKVENTVRYVRESFFNGSEFRSLKELNNKAKDWLKSVNDKIHCSTHEKPIERLKRENLIKAHKLYDLSKIYYRKVGIDSHFSFRGNFYSVPPDYVKKEVVVKTIEENKILVYYRNEQIGFHELEECFKGGYHTSPSHYLELKKLAFKQRIPKTIITKQTEEEEEYEAHISFNAAQVIQLYPEVEQRDLRVYQEEF